MVSDRDYLWSPRTAILLMASINQACQCVQKQVVESWEPYFCVISCWISLYSGVHVACVIPHQGGTDLTLSFKISRTILDNHSTFQFNAKCKLAQLLQCKHSIECIFSAYMYWSQGFSQICFGARSWQWERPLGIVPRVPLGTSGQTWGNACCIAFGLDWIGLAWSLPHKCDIDMKLIGVMLQTFG